MNCLVCHTAEIDGVAYLGAGTKVFDDKWLGEALKTMTHQRWRAVLASSPEDRATAANAYRILTSHHHDKIDSLTRARSTAFAPAPTPTRPPSANLGRRGAGRAPGTPRAPRRFGYCSMRQTRIAPYSEPATSSEAIATSAGRTVAEATS